MKMKKKTVLITAGPTREYIDPVRYISNGSSGKMGYALAEEAKKREADVILIIGPTTLKPLKNVKMVNVVSADEMFNAAKRYFKKADVFISCAAVCDYKPGKYSKNKIKKTNKPVTLKLVPNPDILYEVSNRQPPPANHRLIVGFALETENLLKNAVSKLERKNLDMIVANSPSAMECDNASGAVITKNKITKFKKIPKKRLASLIFDKILEIMPAKQKFS